VRLDRLTTWTAKQWNTTVADGIVPELPQATACDVRHWHYHMSWEPYADIMHEVCTVRATDSVEWRTTYQCTPEGQYEYRYPSLLDSYVVSSELTMSEVAQLIRERYVDLAEQAWIEQCADEPLATRGSQWLFDAVAGQWINREADLPEAVAPYYEGCDIDGAWIHILNKVQSECDVLARANSLPHISGEICVSRVDDPWLMIIGPSWHCYTAAIIVGEASMAFTCDVGSRPSCMGLRSASRLYGSNSEAWIIPRHCRVLGFVSTIPEHRAHLERNGHTVWPSRDALFEQHPYMRSGT